jgi:hypothetical protein
MRSCGDFVANEKLERTLRAHAIQYEDCAAVLVLFDVDDDCPRDVATSIAGRVRRMGPLPFSVAVVCAHREFEAWFLASLESICGGSAYSGDPEARRDAKGWLRREFGYKEVTDQARYTRSMDFDLARTRSRSFRRLQSAIQQIIAASEAAIVVVTPSSLAL